MRYPPRSSVLWFGVLGGAIAFAVQFVVNLAFSFAQCNAPAGRWQLPVHGLEIAVSVAAVATGLAAILICGWLYRHTARLNDVLTEERRGEGSPPPIGRIGFLAPIGLTVNLLTLVIIVMTGIGAPLLPVCQQS
jgi:hypothetical protein